MILARGSLVGLCPRIRVGEVWVLRLPAPHEKFTEVGVIFEDVWNIVGGVESGNQATL